MKILHVTNLTNNKASGISTIVPYHIKWQSQYANVFWFNLSHDYIPPEEFCGFYHGIQDYPKLAIRSLPVPFNKPDLVVFHGIYFYRYVKLAKQLNEAEIPYIVVPHGSLTKSAIMQKRIKKKIGFLLFFGEFLKKSKAIQYLTKGEQEVSENKWNNNYIIIPNGCDIPDKQKKIFQEDGLNGVFIGRKTIYYKGLDILIEACKSIKKELNLNHCKIYIYGPEEEGSNSLLREHIERYGLERTIFIQDAVYNEEKVETLMKSDFFILTSRTEGHPVALLEALSFGIPSLVTTGTNMADEIAKYRAGWTADCDVDSIARALIKVLNNKENISDIGENAYKLSLEYEWSKIGKTAVDNYKTVCIS